MLWVWAMELEVWQDFTGDNERELTVKVRRAGEDDQAGQEGLDVRECAG